VRVAPLIRLAHPFPTLLNAIVAATLAAVAGASVAHALLAAGTMLGIHTAIGALNDLVDLQADARRPEKPLARGQVSLRAARGVIVVGVMCGAACAASLGVVALVMAALGLALGCAYDLGIKRTPLSFAPFALGVALIPPFAWAAAGAALPAAIAALSLAALPAGSALALQNGLADRVLDAAAGVRGLVVRIGGTRAIAAAAALHATALLLIITAAPAGATRAAYAIGGGLMAAGVALSARGSVARRCRGWECSAIGIALCALTTAAAA